MAIRAFPGSIRLTSFARRHARPRWTRPMHLINALDAPAPNSLPPLPELLARHARTPQERKVFYDDCL
jgi:hypothetical protein